jgi:hypothetical protein
MVLRNRLKLERVLLCMVRRKYLVKDDNGAIAITGREDETLPVGRPE